MYHSFIFFSLSSSFPLLFLPFLPISFVVRAYFKHTSVPWISTIMGPSLKLAKGYGRRKIEQEKEEKEKETTREVNEKETTKENEKKRIRMCDTCF